MIAISSLLYPLFVGLVLPESEFLSLYKVQVGEQREFLRSSCQLILY